MFVMNRSVTDYPTLSAKIDQAICNLLLRPCKGKFTQERWRWSSPPFCKQALFFNMLSNPRRIGQKITVFDNPVTSEKKK